MTVPYKEKDVLLVPVTDMKTGYDVMAIAVVKQVMDVKSPDGFSIYLLRISGQFQDIVVRHDEIYAKLNVEHNSGFDFNLGGVGSPFRPKDKKSSSGGIEPQS